MISDGEIENGEARRIFKARPLNRISQGTPMAQGSAGAIEALSHRRARAHVGLRLILLEQKKELPIRVELSKGAARTGLA